MSQNAQFEEIEMYRQELISSLSRIDSSSILRIVEVIANQRKLGKSIFVCGNGGSAAISQHFAIDLGLGTSRNAKDKGCRIIDLTSNAAVVLATANDEGFDKIFAKQIELLGRSGDILIVISSSGNSKNILQALEIANTLDITTVSITGFNGGKAKEISDFAIHVESQTGDYGTVEDAHSFVLHTLTRLLRSYTSEAK